MNRSDAPSRELPPKLWEFGGPAGRNTHFELKVFGQPSAKALRNIIRQLELYAEFVADEDATDEPSDTPHPPVRPA